MRKQPWVFSDINYFSIFFTMKHVFDSFYIKFLDTFIHHCFTYYWETICCTVLISDDNSQNEHNLYLLCTNLQPIEERTNGLVGEEESVRMAQHKVGGSCPAERHLTVSFRKLTADFLKAGLSAGVWPISQSYTNQELRVVAVSEAFWAERAGWSAALSWEKGFLT